METTTESTDCKGDILMAVALCLVPWVMGGVMYWLTAGPA